MIPTFMPFRESTLSLRPRQKMMLEEWGFTRSAIRNI